MNARHAVISRIADRLAGLAPCEPLRVAVDGRTASGKTTFADELVGALGQTGRSVVRASIDGFHRPKAERYRRGRMSAQGYYRDSRDLDAVKTLLLDPLGPRGSRIIRTESFDLAADEPIDVAPREVAEDTILVVDGTFLQRPELAASWDVTIYVRTDPDVCLRRGLERDVELIGGHDQARQIYTTRYQPAYEIYESESSPEAGADAVFDNNDPDAPIVVYRSGGRLA